METTRDMKPKTVVPISERMKGSGSLVLVNRKDRILFTTVTGIDASKRLVEVSLSSLPGEVAVTYADVVHFELTAGGDLVRIVVDLNCFNARTILYDGETLDS